MSVPQGNVAFAEAILATLTRLGARPPDGARILDFGCGGGALVYGFRDLGFDAYGFDLVAQEQLREPSDARLFASVERDKPFWDVRADDAEMVTPFPAASFDAIVSAEMIEHCFPLEGVMRECARLLKPGGVALHIYPGINGLIDPHIFVPLSPRIHVKPWLRLWAWLGVRNAFQEGMPVAEIVRLNRNFFDHGVIYRSNRVIRQTAARYFDHVRMVSREYQPAAPWRYRLRQVREALAAPNRLEALARLEHQNALMTRGPRTSGAEVPAENIRPIAAAN